MVKRVNFRGKKVVFEGKTKKMKLLKKVENLMKYLKGDRCKMMPIPIFFHFPIPKPRLIPKVRMLEGPAC